MRNAKNGKLDLPIYRAINKYGFHNFTVDILESFIPDPNISNLELIQTLDKLEIEYIENTTLIQRDTIVLKVVILEFLDSR